MNVYSTPQYDDFTGFTFNGQHSSQFGLLRVSNGDRYEDTLVLSSSDEAADIPGGPGQYYWGETLKARTFPINIAYDEVTEVDKRRIKKWLHPDDKLHELIFDERPYVKYWVKCTKEVKASELCFKVDGKRVYRGEFDIEFTAYMPYGVAVAKTYDSSAIKRTYTGDTPDSQDDWKDASGLLSSSDYNGNKIDVCSGELKTQSSSGVECRIYNPGDVETDFELEFLTNNNRINLTWGGIASSSGAGSWSLVTTVLDEKSTGTYAIIQDGLWKQFNIVKNIFPNVDSEVKGIIIIENNSSKFESSEDGKVYDIYKYSTDSAGLVKFSAPAEGFDLTSTYIVYAIHRKTNKVYKFNIISISTSGSNKTIYALPIDIAAASIESESVDGIWGDIAKSSNCIIGINIAERNPVKEFAKVSLIFPSAATIHPSDWSEAQKALFYNSTVKINTGKKTISYQINDTEYNLTGVDWTGIPGVLNNPLFKIPLITNTNTYLNIQSSTLQASGFKINYTYLYK